MKTLDTSAYVYVWFTHDWVPFYVGMGKTSSRWNPLRIKRKDRNPALYGFVQKISPDTVRVQKIDNLSWSEAQQKEKSLIAHFGRKKDGGLLLNLTDGGEGVTSPSREVLEAKRKRLLDPSNPMREYHKILNTDPEIKKRRIEGIRAAQDKRREKMSDPEALAQRKARLKATMNSAEYSEKRKEWDTPEYRARLSAAKREYWRKKREAKNITPIPT